MRSGATGNGQTRRKKERRQREGKGEGKLVAARTRAREVAEIEFAGCFAYAGRVAAVVTFVYTEIVRPQLHPSPREEEQTKEQKKRKETFRHCSRPDSFFRVVVVVTSLLVCSLRFSKDEFSSLPPVPPSQGKERKGLFGKVARGPRCGAFAKLSFSFSSRRGFFARFWLLLGLGKRSIGAISPIDFVLHAACDAAASCRGAIHFPSLRWIVRLFRSFVKNSRRYFRDVPMRDKFLYPKGD